MTELDLEAIKARCEAATPGPWHHRSTPNSFVTDPDKYSIVVDAGIYEDLSREQQELIARNNRIFSAHARDDVPALVAEVERLRAALAKESDRVMELLYKIDDYKNLYPELDNK